MDDVDKQPELRGWRMLVLGSSRELLQVLPRVELSPWK